MVFVRVWAEWRSQRTVGATPRANSPAGLLDCNPAQRNTTQQEERGGEERELRVEERRDAEEIPAVGVAETDERPDHHARSGESQADVPQEVLEGPP